MIETFIIVKKVGNLSFILSKQFQASKSWHLDFKAIFLRMSYLYIVYELSQPNTATFSNITIAR